MKLNEQESADFDELLQYLSENRQIMVVPENSEGDSRYLTRSLKSLGLLVILTNTGVKAAL